MQRTYIFEPDRFKWKVTIKSYLVLFFGLWCLIQWILSPGLNLWIFGIIAAVYGTVNSFVLKCEPGKIIVDDESITFDARGERKFMISDITSFNIRENANAQHFLRITTKDGKSQRYWINYYYFSEKEDLINELYHIEMLVHPDSLKFRGGDRKKQFMYRPGQEPEGWFLEVDEDDED